MKDKMLLGFSRTQISSSPLSKTRGLLASISDKPLSQKRIAEVRRHFDRISYKDHRDYFGVHASGGAANEVDEKIARKLAVGLGKILGLEDEDLGTVLGGVEPKRFVERLRSGVIEIPLIDFEGRVKIIFEIVASARILAGGRASSPNDSVRRVLEERGLMVQLLSGQFENLLAVRHTLYTLTDGAWGRRSAADVSNRQSVPNR